MQVESVEVVGNNRRVVTRDIIGNYFTFPESSFCQGVREGRIKVEADTWIEFPELSYIIEDVLPVPLPDIKSEEQPMTFTVDEIRDFLFKHADGNVINEFSSFIELKKKQRHPEWEEYQRLKALFNGA